MRSMQNYLKIRISLLWVMLLMSGFALSQQIKLKGTISVHNSKYETGKIHYVKDAFVSAPFTKPAGTDNNGNFSLEFVGMAGGTSVAIEVEKQGLEVVNQHELQQVVINRKLPLRVFVTEKGKLAQAQTELYQISREGLFKRKDAMIARLRTDNEDSKKAIAELEKRFNRKLANRFEAEQLLNTKIAELERRLPGFAKELAIQNLDFASELYIEAYEEFKKGNIEKTIEILDSEKLEASYAESRQHLAEGKKVESSGKALKDKSLEQMDQVMRSYELKAEILSTTFKYADIAALYENLIALQDSLRFNNEILTMCYSKAASAHFKDGSYQKALEYQWKAIGIQKDSLHLKETGLTTSYHQLGNIYNALGKYREALDYQEKAIAIRKGSLGEGHPDPASLYRDIGNTYINLKKYGKALKYHKKSMAMSEESPDTGQAELAATWQGIGNACQHAGSLKKALQYLQKALDMQRKSLSDTHPDLAASYHTAGSIYRRMKNYEKSLQYHQKAISIQEKILKATHPDLAESYSGIARTYVVMKNPARALAYQQKAVNILNAALPGGHKGIKEAEELLEKIKKTVEEQ